MEPFVRTVLLWQICCLWRVRGLSVLFTDHQPLSVIRGQTLLLQAQIQLLDAERVAKVTWERETKTSGPSSTVAEFPLKVSDGRVTLENQGGTLKIRDFKQTDAGIYNITVTDTTGKRRSAQRTVQEYMAVHHVSVMLNVSHHLLHCMETWGTDPSFTWLHEKLLVTEAVGHVSADGTSLQVSGSFCGHFTCVVSNKLGHSSATYTAEPCESTNRSTTTAVVFLLLLLMLVASSLALILWRRRRHGRSRRQRLREPFDDRL